jgi:NitT/TauT family transport system substrate-binding protein
MNHTLLPVSSVPRLSRRQFLRTTGRFGLTAAGLALLEACQGQPAITDIQTESLETTTVRLARTGSLCLAPTYIAEDFLKSDGFTDVQYVPINTGLAVDDMEAGRVDMGLIFSAAALLRLDAGSPFVFLAGIHIGCFELIGNEQMHTIRDLKGKTIGITEVGSPEHAFLSSMAAYVGLDPTKDIDWVNHSQPESRQLFTDGKLDAFLAYAPAAQEMKAKKIGHVVVNSMTDKPWSQYYCCLVAANRDFVRKNPVATKRTLRALLKATDICALQPERAARFMVEKGYTSNYEYALAAMQEIPYNRWREYDPEDTLRFFALRLHEAGMIKNSPEEIIARGADWRFLNDIKKEPVQGSGASMLPGWAGEAQAMSEYLRPASSAAKLRNLFSCFLTSS